MLSAKRLLPILAFAVLLSPSASVDAAQIKSVTLCRNVIEPDLVPVDITETFTSIAPELHAIVVLKDVGEGTRVNGAWVSVNAISTPDYTIDELELEMKEGDETLHFAISKPDADNMPDYEKTQDLMFVKIAGGSRAAPGPDAAADAPGGSAPGAPASPGEGAGAPRARDSAVDRGTPAGGGTGGAYLHPAGFKFSYPEGWTTKIPWSTAWLWPSHTAGAGRY